MALKRLETQSNELQERMEKREQIDAFLTVLLKDKDFGRVLVAKVKEKDLGKLLLKP